MGNDSLNINELRQLAAYYRGAPKLFQRAGVKYINKTAQELKRSIEITLQRNFEIRNENFMRGSVRVENMRRSNGKAVVGSIHRARFSGYEESEKGGKSMKNPFTLNARGGSFAEQSGKVSRFLKGRQFKDESSFQMRNPAKSSQKRASQMLAVAYKTGYKQPFIMTNHKDINPGLFIFQGKKLKRLRKFKDEPKIRHVPWMEKSLDLLKGTHNARATWMKSIKEVGADNYKK